MNLISKIIKSSKREWYWFFEAGKSKKSGNINKLRRTDFKEMPPPVFFLSTGRTGTAWFAKILSYDKKFMIFHNAIPNLSVQNKFFYNILNKNDIDKETKINIGKEIFLTAREEYFLYSYKTQKNFLETNNQFVFFAYVIDKIFPDAKFVHLYRHPGEFVRSGLRRKWYSDDKNSKIKLIEPKNNNNWKNYSEIEKISWLWNETNNFIEKFKNQISKDRIFDFNFNELSVDKFLKLCDFIKIDIPEKKIKKMLNKKINPQKTGEIPKYKNWKNSQKEELRNICSELSKKYSYKL